MRTASRRAAILLLGVQSLVGSGCGSPGAVYNERGIEYAKRGETDRSLEQFDKAVEADPTVSDHFMNRGLAYYLLGQHRRALADLDQAIKLDPANARAYMNRGNVYDDLGERDRAIEDYSQALRLEPNHPGPYRNRAVANIRRGDDQSALADLDRAIALDPAYTAAYLTRACLYSALQRADRAAIDYAKARELAPNRVPELTGSASVAEVSCRSLGGVPTRIMR